MKQVWANRSTCSRTAATTRGWAWPTPVTAMPDPRSIRVLPSTSVSSAPEPLSIQAGSTVETPAATAAVRRAVSSRDRGPGSSVTSRRLPVLTSPLITSLMASE